MFNFFKKSPEKISEISEQPTSVIVSQYPKEVIEIHNEFNTAGEKLLAEAMGIIQKAQSPKIDKAKRLSFLGFSQAKTVEESTQILKQAVMSKEVSELVKYYQFNYPNNKFITEEQVKAICFKYNLVCGDVKRFRGFVPEKNLQEIEKFKLKQQDEFDTSKHIFFIADKNSNSGKEIWKRTNIKIEDIKDSSNWFNKRENGYHYTSCFLKNDIYNGAKIVSSRQFPELLNDHIGLKICAPVKDMDLEGIEIKEGYKMFTKIHIPDPVVLMVVPSGFLIVTAWGNEASDELVVNQNHN